MKQRDATFDIMKGIGILLVMTGHFFGWNHPWLAQVILSFHMPLFFFVAGYFSKAYVDGPTSWSYVKRFSRRLIPPFVVTQLAIVAWAVLMAFAKHEGWNPVIRDTLSLFWADVDGPMTPWGKLTIGVIWFLLALFVAKSLLVPLSRLKQWAIPISLALAFGTVLLHRVFPYSLWCVALGLTALPFVTVGWWVKDHPFPLWLNLLCIGCWIAAICFSRLEMYTFTWKCYPLDVLGAYGGTYCVYWISKWMGRYLKSVSKVFAYLGLISLAIMCVHCFEIDSHLGNRICVAVGIGMPDWALFAWRYVLTIGLAIALVHIPKVKNLFV
jgi:fucose 4-O-acetylase-like acetyltransferase